ncbi:MAG: hypothetical protein OXI15_00355 [Chromatiales bacterium]|nr:hypothetical protein [Chromatiales bacterium]
MESGAVYVIAKGAKHGNKPDLCSKDIVYIGYTEQNLQARLNQFGRACQGKRGHAGGDSYFQTCICPEFGDKIEELRESGLNRVDAAKEAMKDPCYRGRENEFEDAWKNENRNLFVSAWNPPHHWSNSYESLPKREQLKFVEAKLQVEFVRKNKRLPQHNKTFS